MSQEIDAHGHFDALALKRSAVIDVGSNSVRLVVFDGAARSPGYFFNEKVYCGLGADLETTGRLSVEGRDKALRVLERFSFLLSDLKTDSIIAVATAAVRDAEDGPEFCAEVQRKTGIKVRVLSGAEEGRFAALGVLLGDHRAEGVVADIGGASMELATARQEGAGLAQTTALGPLRLQALGLSGSKLREYIHAALENSWPQDAPPDAALYLVGGGWRAFAKLMMRSRKYPLDVLHGFESTVDETLDAAHEVLKEDPAALAKRGISKARALNAPLTAEVLVALLETHAPSKVIISACGLREGLLYDALSPELRAQDPLLVAAQLMEDQQARFPGQGQELAEWISPILPEIPDRLLRSACHLADVSWRSHPDYRAGACFTTATDPSLLGMTHRERMILAVALANRYKGARSVLQMQDAVQLLTQSEIDISEAVGKLIRLGAMVTGISMGVISRLNLIRDPITLTLSIPEGLEQLVSPALETRLNSAAQALKLEGRLERRSSI